jgi:YVTN family beta-propeller protein
VTNSGSNNISVIDTFTNNVTATINIGGYPWGVTVTPNGTKVYVTSWEDDFVSVIDIFTNNVIAKIPVGMHPCGVAATPDGTKIYVANYDGSSVSVIDTATDNITATVDVEDHPIEIAFGHFTGFNMTNQSTEVNVVEINNSSNKGSESDNGNGSVGNETSKNHSIPGFRLLGDLVCLYIGWQFRKQ